MFDPGLGPEDEEVVWAGPVTDEDMGEEGWEEVGEGGEKGLQEITEKIYDGEAEEPVKQTTTNLLEENTLHHIEVPPFQHTVDAMIMSLSGVTELMDEHEVMDGCSESESLFLCVSCVGFRILIVVVWCGVAFAQEYIDYITDNWI